MPGDEALDGVAGEPAPGLGGNSGPAGPGLSSASQVRITLTVWAVSGVARSLRPLPWQRTCGPAPRWMSWRFRP